MRLQGPSPLTIPVWRFIGILAPVTLAAAAAMLVARQSRSREVSLGTVILIAAAATAWFAGLVLCVVIRPSTKAIVGPDEERLSVAMWRRMGLSVWTAAPVLLIAFRNASSGWSILSLDIAWGIIPLGIVILPFVLYGKSWIVSSTGLAQEGILRGRRSIEWGSVAKVEAWATLIVVTSKHGQRIVLDPRLVDGVPVLATRLLEMQHGVEFSADARGALMALAQK